MRSRLRRRAQFLALLLGTVPMAGQAVAQNAFWNVTLATAQNWGTSTNWSLSSTGGATTAAPTLSVTANFNSTAANIGTKTIFMGGNRSALGLVFTSPGGFVLRTNQSTTTVQTLSIGAGGITVNAGVTALGFFTTQPGQT
ncbi:MAG: hypothetical protein SGI77_03960, partial [Pirellulaceae bacterium]|nr:hypothetical protein [Pirellulaceae bacterium]